MPKKPVTTEEDSNFSTEEGSNLAAEEALLSETEVLPEAGAVVNPDFPGTILLEEATDGKVREVHVLPWRDVAEADAGLEKVVVAPAAMFQPPAEGAGGEPQEAPYHLYLEVLDGKVREVILADWREPNPEMDSQIPGRLVVRRADELANLDEALQNLTLHQAKGMLPAARVLRDLTRQAGYLSMTEQALVFQFAEWLENTGQAIATALEGSDLEPQESGS